MFETGLAVGRSLGRNGIDVYGLDYKKDIGFYSKYVKPRLCPHPLTEERKFIKYLIELGTSFNEKPVIFIASDEFLISVSRNREILKNHFTYNLPGHELIDEIMDKYKQYQLSRKACIPVPRTFSPGNIDEFNQIKNKLKYPVFIKARDVNSWRAEVGGAIKGFTAKDEIELGKKFSILSGKKIKTIVQEIITGPDTNHFKVCIYISKSGELKLLFILRKIRQNPIHFGVGCVVESINYPELEELGKKLFTTIGYRGIGSAEFKLDDRDGQLKLIEINPRYWQQNGLAEVCGMNFPLINYLDVTGQELASIKEFKENIKWINLYMDLDSYLQYREEKKLTFFSWLKSLRGKKVFSDFSFDDIKPGFYEIGFGKKLIKIPLFLFKRLF
jgi:predicted ATP-grasp superfamily ATP-dependent carboligase